MSVDASQRTNTHDTSHQYLHQQRPTATVLLTTPEPMRRTEIQGAKSSLQFRPCFVHKIVHPPSATASPTGARLLRKKKNKITGSGGVASKRMLILERRRRRMPARWAKQRRHCWDCPVLADGFVLRLCCFLFLLCSCVDDRKGYG